MTNINLCKRIIDDFFSNEEVKKHINVNKYKNVSFKENIRYFTSMNSNSNNSNSNNSNSNNSNNNNYILNCTINPNFIISEYTTYINEDKTKNVYLNAVYHNDKKYLYFNTTINKNDYKLKT